MKVIKAIGFAAIGVVIAPVVMIGLYFVAFYAIGAGVLEALRKNGNEK